MLLHLRTTQLPPSYPITPADSVTNLLQVLYASHIMQEGIGQLKHAVHAMSILRGIIGKDVRVSTWQQILFSPNSRQKYELTGYWGLGR